MPLTTDPNEPSLKQIRPDGQQESYLVLSEKERAEGYVRPVRTVYRHTGIRPVHPTRPLTPDEQKHHASRGYVVWEEYPPGESAVVGRFWTQEQLSGGCGVETKMSQEIAETYARDPIFYGATYCCNCKKHFPVGANGEFVWQDGTRVGT